MKCENCNGIVKFEGDSPLPDGLSIRAKGLIEHHCGFERAIFPRFTFMCPSCVTDISEYIDHWRKEGDSREVVQDAR